MLTKQADTPVTWADQARPDSDVDRLVARYRRRVGPLARLELGRARQSLRRERYTEHGSMGAVAARAQRRLARSDIAFVNEGNVRDEVAAGPVSYTELFRASAYEFPLLKMSLTGAQVKQILSAQHATSPPITLHTAGLRGRTIDLRRRYTVAVNQLLAEQPAFSAFSRGRGTHPIGTDLEALVRYVKSRTLLD